MYLASNTAQPLIVYVSTDDSIPTFRLSSQSPDPVLQNSSRKFAAASGIVDHDTFGPEPGQGKAHGHAVIIVGRYGAGVRHAGIDSDAVLCLFAVDAHAGQFRADGMDTVTFLETDVTDACNTGGTVSKRRNSCQSDG